LTARLRPCGLRRGSLRYDRLAEPKQAQPAKAGGARRDRTADLVIANDALSQLSYGPIVAASNVNKGGRQSAPFTIRAKVKSRTAKSPFSASFARNFPCLQGGEPIFSRKSNPRPNPRVSPAMRAVLDIVLIVLDLYVWLLIASAILSWLIAFNVVNTRNQFVAAVAEFLYRITEPVLAPIRSFMPSLGGLDISPIILILIIMFIQRVITYYIYPSVF
jgi:YggT family protein